MTFFVFWVAYRYGHIKLGPKDAQPEFSDACYFSMLFSAGIVSTDAASKTQTELFLITVLFRVAGSWIVLLRGI